MLQTPEDYLRSLPEPGSAWLRAFLDYFASHHSDISPIMFRQRPMFRVGKSYLLFSVAKTHFSVHTMNFDLIESLRETLPKADFGKGCVKVKFSDEGAKPVLFALCDEVIRLNSLPDAPAVDVSPELPYDEALEKAFSGGKAKWMPLYQALRDRAKARLPDFREYFPAVNVLWKHETTFAQISAVNAALRLEFFADRLHPEWNPVKTQQTSKNRVAHTVELTGEEHLDGALAWILASYTLTEKKK